MADENYAASKAFVKEMRALASRHDLDSIRQAVQKMRVWLREHPDDIHVGTALEEFDILEEAALLREEQTVSTASSIAKAS